MENYRRKVRLVVFFLVSFREILESILLRVKDIRLMLCWVGIVRERGLREFGGFLDLGIFFFIV